MLILLSDFQIRYYYSQKIKLHFPEEMAANYQHVTNKHNMDIKFPITYHGHKSVP